jgi:hypothetical protein
MGRCGVRARGEARLTPHQVRAAADVPMHISTDGRDYENRFFIVALFSTSCGTSHQPALRITMFHTALTCPVSAFS